MEHIARAFGATPCEKPVPAEGFGFLVGYCSFVWRRFYNEQFDKHKTDDALVDIPDSLSERTYIFFKTKIGLLFFGYVFLLIGAVTKLRIF